MQGIKSERSSRLFHLGEDRQVGKTGGQAIGEDRRVGKTGKSNGQVGVAGAAAGWTFTVQQGGRGSTGDRELGKEAVGREWRGQGSMDPGRAQSHR